MTSTIFFEIAFKYTDTPLQRTIYGSKGSEYFGPNGRNNSNANRSYKSNHNPVLNHRGALFVFEEIDQLFHFSFSSVLVFGCWFLVFCSKKPGRFFQCFNLSPAHLLCLQARFQELRLG
jgi:hypothetical protein